MPSTFHDEEAVRWTVVARPATRSDEPGRTDLLFTSERGERRRCDACLPEGGSWDDVDERAWRALLHHSELMRAGNES